MHSDVASRAVSGDLKTKQEATRDRWWTLISLILMAAPDGQQGSRSVVHLTNRKQAIVCLGRRSPRAGLTGYGGRGGRAQGRVAGLAFMDFGAVAVQAQPVVKGLLSGTPSVRPSATAFMGAAFFQVPPPPPPPPRA